MACECAICKNNKPFTFPKEIIDAALDGELVLFCGAGISTESKNVLPYSFYTSIKNELDVKDESVSFSDLMQLYCNQPNGRKKLLKRIRERFNYISSFPELERQATAFHQELAQIYPIRTIITTNWDTYFEDYCGAIPITIPEDFAFWDDNSRCVLKIHGSIQNLSSIIATSEDYTIGIFSAIYFVINFAFMLLGGIHPVLWMLMPGFIAVFAGIPFMLMVAKVQKPGAVFLMGLITALIYFATGQFTLVILISMASTCILAEVVRMVTKYNSFKGNSIAYVIFSLGMVGSPLPIWLFKADFLAQITEQGMPADYVAAVEALSSNAMLIVLFVAPIIGGIIGAFIARSLFKKHFVKAGIV